LHGIILDVFDDTIRTVWPGVRYLQDL